MRKSGFTLVEFMVVIGISSVAAFGVMQVALNNQKSANYQEQRMGFLGSRFLLSQVSRENPDSICKSIHLQPQMDEAPEAAEVARILEAIRRDASTAPRLPVQFEVLGRSSPSLDSALREALASAPSAVDVQLGFKAETYRCVPDPSGTKEVCSGKVEILGKIPNGIAPQPDRYDVRVNVEIKNERRMVQSCSVGGVGSRSVASTIEGMCPAGQAMRGIQNGELVCEPINAVIARGDLELGRKVKIDVDRPSSLIVTANHVSNGSSQAVVIEVDRKSCAADSYTGGSSASDTNAVCILDIDAGEHEIHIFGENSGGSTRTDAATTLRKRLGGSYIVLGAENVTQVR